MKQKLTNQICTQMQNHLTPSQIEILRDTLICTFTSVSLGESEKETISDFSDQNTHLIELFIAAKKIEGCSNNTLKYYTNTLNSICSSFDKNVRELNTNDLRLYLSNYQNSRKTSKVTLDNIRRIMSSFFAWLEDEDYITKSPVRRIRKVKATKTVRETLSDEHLERLRDQCVHPRDLAIVDLLIATGVRVGELVRINQSDIDFLERECVVLGKGDKERKVYFDAKTKIHLQQYLETRTDDNPALFVSYRPPYNRLSIAGVERFLRNLGIRSDVQHVHPHKFRQIGKSVV